MAIWRMRIAYWIRKAKNALSQYVILVVLPLQQWLHEAPHFYVIRPLPDLLKFFLTFHSIPSTLVYVWHTVFIQPKSTGRHDLCNIIYSVIGRLTVWIERMNTIE